MRIAVVTPIPTPYRDPLWNHVAAQPGVELDVYYCSAGKADRPWAVSWERRSGAEVLKGVNLLKFRRADEACYFNPAIWDRLRAGSYDALVVGGYNHVTMVAAIAFALAHGVPYFLMNESHLRNPRSRWRRRVKETLVRSAVTHAHGGFPTGTLATEYLAHYGAPAASLCTVPNATDVVGLWRTASELRPGRAEIRARLGIGEEPAVLFAGRLIPKKGVDALLRAFAAVRKNMAAKVLVVGDGPVWGELEGLARDLDLSGAVVFAGFTQPEELPKYYAAADLFALPSSETWGVVVLEALASGLPVIVTDRVGCHVDAVTGPAVGEVVKHGDVGALARALETRLTKAARWDAVAEAWAARRRDWSYEALAVRFVSHLRTNTELRRPGKRPLGHRATGAVTTA